MFYFCGCRPAEERRLALLNAQFDPEIYEMSEGLVGGEALIDLGDTVGTNEAAHWFTAMDIGQFWVRPVTLWMFRVHASAPRMSADLILVRHAAGMHGAQGQ